MTKHTKLALFLLRLGLGIVILLWGMDKILEPSANAIMLSTFYYIKPTAQIVSYIGIAQVLFALAFMAGIWKRYMYGLNLLIHVVSTAALYKMLMFPFGPNHLFVGLISVLLASITLYMLRLEDTQWSLS